MMWQFKEKFAAFSQRRWWQLLIAMVLIFGWTNHELFSFGFPVNLYNATYYKPSMVFYCLVIISLISTYAFRSIKSHSFNLPIFHFLANYAYRAFLSHVFWLEMIILTIWPWVKFLPLSLAVVICYLGTWIISFGSAVGFHVVWKYVKRIV